MIKVLIAGASGMLGTSLVWFLNKNCSDMLIIPDHSNVINRIDFTDIEKVKKYLDFSMPDVIVNLIALTNVDLCGFDLQMAYKTNTKSVENICSWILDGNNSCELIQISTDHVYNGIGPHLETDITICNNYAMTKYAGEIVARQVRGCVLRTNFFGKSRHRNRQSFTDWVYRSSIDKKKINLFTDVLISPLSINTLCEMISIVIRCRPQGTFNLGSANGISKADLATEFCKYLSIPVNLFNYVKMKDCPVSDIIRPNDMRMNCSKIQNTLCLDMPCIHSQIKYVVGDY